MKTKRKQEQAVHYNYGGAPFCGTRMTPKVLLTETSDDATCKRCAHKIGLQADATGNRDLAHGA